ncbi:MAG: DCC1-like thiol-disulfide oxidoreductase family protein [Fulvivirga sp.]|nr:DCC1-like thiol-disulfide oxidoreductase family protein [Fulvivirga sp.]
MFQTYNQIDFKPRQPLLIWDGACGFCKFWMLAIKDKVEGDLRFVPYQEIASDINDIPEAEFKKASRLIEPSGKVYSGPASIYRCLCYLRKPIRFPNNWYEKSGFFKWVSDHAYHLIAKNRPAMMQVTKLLFGKNPKNLKMYWVLWLLILILIAVSLPFVLT